MSCYRELLTKMKVIQRTRKSYGRRTEYVQERFPKGQSDEEILSGEPSAKRYSKGHFQTAYREKEDMTSVEPSVTESLMYYAKKRQSFYPYQTKPR